MVDVQSEIIEDGETIDKVGIKNLSYPVIVKDKYEELQSTVATINMYVQLPKHFRGTHMSRFLEVLNEQGRLRISRKRVRNILVKMKEALDAETAHIEFFFPYFVKKTAPVSGATCPMAYQCALYGTHDAHRKFRLILEVNAMVLNLCPCSKELSPHTSAHNQRSRVTVRLRSGPLIWIEDVIEIIEASASSPIYPLLKRVDEKTIMDAAYENPRFVEDIVRIITARLSKMDGLYWFSVESENFESIHNHNVYAFIERRIDNEGSQ